MDILQADSIYYIKKNLLSSKFVEQYKKKPDVEINKQTKTVDGSTVPQVCSQPVQWSLENNCLIFFSIEAHRLYLFFKFYT